jgi:hypothetical protein
VTVRRCKEPDCGQEAVLRVQRCLDHQLMRSSPLARQIAAQERLDAVPEVARRKTVPEREWPAGRRWCGGCQTFMLLQDCSGSRCRACASLAAHKSRIKSTFGLSPEDYQWLLDVQGGRCAICRVLPRVRRFAVDHQHGHDACGGKGCPLCVRGLICAPCNSELLTAARHSVQILRNAVEYLEHPPMLGAWSRPEVELMKWRAAHPEAGVEEATPPPF